MFERQDSERSGSSVGRCSRMEGRSDKRKERLNTRLLDATWAGDLQLVKSLLSDGASPEARCRKSQLTALHLSAYMGYDMILVHLLSSQPSAARIRDRNGRLPHHLAAARGKLSCLQAIVCTVQDVVNDAVIPKSAGDLAPDTLDSWNHHHEQFNNELKPSNLTSIGRTALHIAADRCDSAMVEFLLIRGANHTIVDINGLSALDVAAQHTDKECSVVDSETSGTCIESYFRNSKTGTETEKERSPEEKVCELLLNSGAALPRAQVIVKDGVVVSQRRMNVTTLHTAVSQENMALADLLLKRGACPLTWDNEGLTAIHVCVRKQSEDMLRLLLTFDCQAVLEARDIQGRTPLLQAVEEGWEDGVDILSEAGADVTVTSNSGQTVLHVAAKHGRVFILEELLSIPAILRILERTNNSYETPLSVAVKMDQYDCVKLLCEKGAYTEVLLPGDQSLLHIAVMNNSLRILQSLLNSRGKARIDLRTREDRGWITPLHITAMEGYAECAEELLSMGADPWIKTKKEENALHLACKAGHVDVALHLIRRDGDLIEAKNTEGWKPLHLAAAEGHVNCVQQIICHGGDLSSTVKYEASEKTALDIISCSIPKSPEFLEDIFDRQIEVIKGPVNDPECEILLNFGLMMPKGHNEKQLKVIGAIMNNSRQSVKDKLMLHPLIESFLYLKWRKFSSLFIFTMALYFVLTVAITTLAHITFVERTNSMGLIAVATTSRIVLFTVLVPILFVEIINLSQLQRYYFMDYESWVKWTVIAFTFVFNSLDPDVFWVRYVAAVAVLLSWIELLFLLSRCPTWGFYVLMFSKVAIKTIKVLATFSLLMLGFAFSFLILFEARVPFTNLLESIVKVIVMMFEFDYGDMFADMDGHLNTFSIVGRLMMAVFVLLVAMVMMNLIVGVAVSDISRLEEQGRTEQLVKQASFLGFLEMLMYSKRFRGLPKSFRKALESRRSVQRTVLLKPGRPSASQVFLPKALVDNILFRIKTRNVGDVDVSGSLQDLTERIDNISTALREFYTNHHKAHLLRNDQQFENILKLILNEQRKLRDNLREQKRELRDSNDVTVRPIFSTQGLKPDNQMYLI